MVISHIRRGTTGVGLLILEMHNGSCSQGRSRWCDVNSDQKDHGRLQGPRQNNFLSIRDRSPRSSNNVVMMLQTTGPRERTYFGELLVVSRNVVRVLVSAHGTWALRLDARLRVSPVETASLVGERLSPGIYERTVDQLLRHSVEGGGD